MRPRNNLLALASLAAASMVAPGTAGTTNFEISNQDPQAPAKEAWGFMPQAHHTRRILNQRQKRKAARARHAHGDRRAFSF